MILLFLQGTVSSFILKHSLNGQHKGAYTGFYIYEMIISVRFCLSYDPLKCDFIALKRNNQQIRKDIVDTDVVNAVTYSRQSVITCDHTIFMT